MKIKLSKSAVIQAFVGLGFKSAIYWPDETLRKRILFLPNKVDPKGLPPEFAPIFSGEVQEEGDIELVVSAPETKPPTPAQTESTPAQIGSTPTQTGSATPTHKTKSACLSAKIRNALSSGEWKTDKEIADGIRASLSKTRFRLYSMMAKGQVEHERIFRYRRAQAKDASGESRP
jgi:hypothetical protein